VQIRFEMGLSDGSEASAAFVATADLFPPRSSAAAVASFERFVLATATAAASSGIPNPVENF